MTLVEGRVVHDRYQIDSLLVGCAAVAGNVLEWVADWYDAAYYARSSIRNPHGPAEGDRRVARGGSWSSLRRRFLRCANRDKYVPNTHGIFIGFRCAVSGDRR